MYLISDRAECIYVLLIWMGYIIAFYLRYIICVQEFFSFFSFLLWALESFKKVGTKIGLGFSKVPAFFLLPFNYSLNSIFRNSYRKWNNLRKPWNRCHTEVGASFLFYAPEPVAGGGTIYSGRGVPGGMSYLPPLARTDSYIVHHRDRNTSQR